VDMQIDFSLPNLYTLYFFIALVRISSTVLKRSGEMVRGTSLLLSQSLCEASSFPVLSIKLTRILWVSIKLRKFSSTPYLLSLFFNDEYMLHFCRMLFPSSLNMIGWFFPLTCRCDELYLLIFKYRASLSHLGWIPLGGGI
jgi:hypothetical protein